jgi:hypothetical protein
LGSLKGGRSKSPGGVVLKRRYPVKEEFKKLKAPRRQKPRIGFVTDDK